MVAESCWTVAPARFHRAVVATRVMHILHIPRARHEFCLEDGEVHPQDKDPGTQNSERYMVEEKTVPLLAGRSEPAPAEVAQS
jgi:hypothetical protein